MCTATAELIPDGFKKLKCRNVTTFRKKLTDNVNIIITEFKELEETEYKYSVCFRMSNNTNTENVNLLLGWRLPAKGLYNELLKLEKLALRTLKPFLIQ